MEEKTTDQQDARCSSAGIFMQEKNTVIKFLKRMLAAYIRSAGAYRHPMMWPH